MLAPLMGQGAHGQGELAHGHWYIHILWPWHLMQPWPWPSRGQGRSYSTRINVYGGGCGICLPWDTLYNQQHAVYNTAHTPVPPGKFPSNFKTDLLLFHLLSVWSLWNFAHAKTAELSWYVQNVIVFSLVFNKVQPITIFLELYKFEWNVSSGMGARSDWPLLPWIIRGAARISPVPMFFQETRSGTVQVNSIVSEKNSISYILPLVPLSWRVLLWSAHTPSVCDLQWLHCCTVPNISCRSFIFMFCAVICPSIEMNPIDFEQATSVFSLSVGLWILSVSAIF